MIELTTNAGNDFVFDDDFSDSSATSLNSSMSSVTMFTDFDEDSFGTNPGDPFLRPPGQISIEGENRMTFLAAQHDRMPMKPRRSPHRDAVCTEKEDQRPVMPKRDLSNRSLCTSASFESKGSAVIAESLKSKPDSNLPPVYSPVVSSTPFLPKPRQLPAQIERSAAIAEYHKPKPPSSLPYSSFDLAASSNPFLPKLTQLPAQTERSAAIAEYLKLLKPASNLPYSDLAASSNPFAPKLGQLPAQTERSAAIAESLRPTPASNLPYMEWTASSNSTPLKRKGSKSDVSLEEEGSIDFFKSTHSNGTDSTQACSSEDGFSPRRWKKEKKKKFKSTQCKEKKSSKKEKEGNRSSSKDLLSPRRVSEPRQRRLSLLGKKRSVMNLKWKAIAQNLTVILEDNEEEAAKLDDRSLRTCSF
jgi:hypothetical protein